MRISAIPLLIVMLFLGLPAVARADENPLHLLPMPTTLKITGGCRAQMPRTLPLTIDPAAMQLLSERWRGLGIRVPERSKHSNLIIRIRGGVPQEYTLRTAPGQNVEIDGSDRDGVFYGLMTLAQLAQRHGSSWSLPCVQIADQPALRWRILSDDVSRGPLPNMTYFKERIRTIASFKMNGYSPYMEHVFSDPGNPLPAPLDGITPAQLGELAAYAKHFHVEFIPEQQTFAHMHNTLKYEEYASAAERPHGFLLSPASPTSLGYLTQLISDELAIVPHPKFFHIGSDETSTLGVGQSASMVEQQGLSQVYAGHINQMARLIAPSGARVMLWDDGIERTPAIMKLIPKNAVVINWHYGDEKTFVPYIKLLASGGFDQMVAPGANNWNEIYPDIATALRNEELFIDEGKAARVFGLFQTVWHDDGESLFEATWYPVIYSAAAGWESRTVDPTRFAGDFGPAFFGSSDPRYGTDIAKLADVVTQLELNPYDSTDYLFWADPFDPRIAERMRKVDLHDVRLKAESVMTHLIAVKPPLHRNAAAVMFLGARRFDALARNFQIAQEVRDYYAEAKSQIGVPHSRTYVDLYWCKYWFWEMRDSFEDIAPLYAQAWHYENRPSHLAGNLERYNLAAGRAIERADKIQVMTEEDYLRHKRFPTLEQTLDLPVALSEPQ